MKKLINAPDTVVRDMLRGIEAMHPECRVDHTNRVVLRARPKADGKVAVVSGGGSGHEPLHAGYVGEGMLDAACVGEVFTSPTPDQVLAATTAVDGGAGVLHIVKNYTGDVMNFEMGAELAQAEGIDVRTVVVADDVAVEDSTFTAGRRGVAGTALVEKIVGAAAEEGMALDELVGLAERVAANVRTMGLALTSCVTPAAGTPTFDLPDDEMEVGIGIHGEPGRHREPFVDAAHATRALLDPVLADLDFPDADVVLLVNGTGGTPLMELYVVAAEAHDLLAERGVRVARRKVGDVVTSLEMQGCSLTLLRADAEMLRLLDAPAHTPAWTQVTR
ncbi:dihydroxyacetone kinase subunit DhaK [uncultured Tessaracoccus sp.]|uniref:dihydroxyacetone kinase subunit DhaK n=1 Tax=uncultured Tessaracoccus sp. TaxID=905023 RepID=UPI0025E57A23|nr:dihydroxyacetone kinase subunit DhaK [uncultured Tessaracoccus sp.]